MALKRLAVWQHSRLPFLAEYFNVCIIFIDILCYPIYIFMIPCCLSSTKEFILFNLDVLSKHII